MSDVTIASRNSKLSDAPHKSEEFFRSMVEAVTEYAIFAIDREGYILTWNTGAHRLKGYTEEEIIGQHFSKFYPAELIASGHPQHELEIALKVGRYEEEGLRVRKDGSTFWANVVLTPLRNKHGEHIGFSKVTRDITDRRNADALRFAEEQKFRLLVEGVKDYAILMLNPQGLVSSWNEGARRFKGWQANEIIGKHFSTFYPAEDIAAKKPEMELEIAARVGRFEDEGWRVKKDGGRFWANVIITALIDKDDKLVGFSKVTRDLTERRLAEQQLVVAYEGLETRIQEKTAELEEALKARDEFISIASHELKTPITGMKMQVQMAKLRLTQPKNGVIDIPRQIKALEVADSQLDRLTQLIEDLLDISRIQAGKLSYNFELTSFSEMFHELLDSFAPQLAAAECEMKIYIDPQLEGYWDRLRLEQVISNLISNAIKYAPGAPIVVFAKRNDNKALITVQDFGPGIPENQRGKIFERFERLGQTRNVGGLGLGLYISRQIIVAHGGTLTLRGGSDNGSTFVISVPLDSRHMFHTPIEKPVLHERG